MAEYVKYIGPAHVRRILREDWRAIGLDGETVEWSYLNGFSVPADQFTDKQMNMAIKTARDFVIVGGEENAPQALPQVMTPDQATAPQVDLNAVVSSDSTESK